MKYTVENHYQKLQELINNYPQELKDMIEKGDLDSFKKYIKFCQPITKDLIGAYIHYCYCRWGNMFVSAELANYMMEALEVLTLQESISYIEDLYQLYNYGCLYDTARIQIRLRIGSMTIEDVLKEEQENKEEFQKNIKEYLNILTSKMTFTELYKKINNSNRSDNKKIYEEETRRKIKALHCANHLYHIMKTAEEINEIAQKIYMIIDKENPEVIVNIETDSEYRHLKYYYFETEGIDGAIIEEENDQSKEKKYTITSTVQYLNFQKEPRAFAKIRIVEDENKIIQLKGNRTGNCFSQDYYDIDFLAHPDSELPIILKKMKKEVESVLTSIEKDPIKKSEIYQTKWVKEYIKENKE